MEEEIEEIRTKVEKFMEKYNCSVRIDSTYYGWTQDGKIAYPKAKIIVES
mgnify:CR=1 FL=1